MPAKPNEIQITRVYDAPVKLVWDAWTDPKQVEKWWGPRGFTLTTHSKELRPGGKWIYTMHGPDGTDYPNITTYHEVVPHQRLVYDHGGNAEREKLFSVVATFQEEKGKTTLVLTFSFTTEEVARQMKHFIKLANGNSTWDRLGEYLENETEGKDIFLIHRSFAAEPQAIFAMWTDPDRLARWLGHGKLDYQEISPPHCLVYTQSLRDQNIAGAKLSGAPACPDQLLTSVTFTTEDSGETRVRIRWEIHGEATEAERHSFRELKPAMMAGWNESFDQLEALLA